MRGSKRSGNGIVPEWAISRLETLPEVLFKQTVFHLLGGGSVTDLASYIYVGVLDKPGSLSDCSQETLRRYLTAMRLRLEEWLQNPRVETAPPWLKKVLDAASSDSDCGADKRAAEFDEIKRLAALAEHVDALTLLKQTFLVAVQQQEALGAVESKYGILLPAATENIRTMLKIADEIRKIELIEAFPKLKQNEGRRILRDATRATANNAPVS